MANITITPGTAMAKGTLMTITGKTAAATAKDGNANAVLAYDIDEKATTATVYVGTFQPKSASCNSRWRYGSCARRTAAGLWDLSD